MSYRFIFKILLECLKSSVTVLQIATTHAAIDVTLLCNTTYYPVTSVTKRNIKYFLVLLCNMKYTFYIYGMKGKEKKSELIQTRIPIHMKQKFMKVAEYELRNESDYIRLLVQRDIDAHKFLFDRENDGK